jgi:tRNA (guanine37-N1)-methyltransferase
MRFHVLTLFPGMFPGPLEDSIVGLACQRGLISIQVTDIRNYTHDAHGTADDYQFGGGPGMVLKPEPVFEAVEDVSSGWTQEYRDEAEIILLSPQGRVFDQGLAEELALAPAMILICGHYAGMDDRVRQRLITREISVGDFVLTGGELPAMILIDTISRLVPGVVGSADNVAQDSISSGLLQHPLFTRPAQYRDMAVPEVLRSGHHAEIEGWRRRESLRRTFEQRPGLLETAGLGTQDLEYLETLGYRR